jgi:hypothetical protein
MSTTLTTEGWRCDYDIVPGFGLVLTNVSHANYRLARDIRVVAVCAGAADPNENSNALVRMWGLGGPACPLVSGPTPTPTPTPPKDYLFQQPITGLSAVFKPTSDVFADQLTITQDYQFTAYGLKPAHEPGGVLQAARLLPLVTFRCDAIPSPGDRISYIRIDYRMKYTLDVFTKNPPEVDWTAALALNQAGIFPRLRAEKESGLNRVTYGSRF